MSQPISMAKRHQLRAEHTCTREATSMSCRACDRAVPFPSAGATLTEVIETLFPRLP